MNQLFTNEFLDSLLSGANAVMNWLLSLGPSVLIPLILTILGTAFGAGFKKSLKAGLTFAVGLIGLNLVINQLLGVNLAPAAEHMVQRFGLALSVIDVGWPASSAIAVASTVGLFVIPLCIAVNILMLLTRCTQTIDVDIWNYWHFAFTGALVVIVTNNVLLGFTAAALNMVIVLVLADITAPQVEKSLGLPGVSIPHGFTAAFVPIAFAINALIDKIPFIRDINFDLESVQKRFGVFGEPLFVGFVLGSIIGAVGFFDPHDPAATIPLVLTTGVSLGAVLVLIPRMAALLMEGLMPISEAAASFIKKRVTKRKNSQQTQFYIGLDSAVGIGNPVTLSLALILIPVMLLLAVLLQSLGNQVIPFGDLATATYMLVLVTPIVRNNAFRGLIVGTVVLGIGLLIATYMAPLQTAAALNSGFDIAKAAGSSQAMISSLCDGANPLTFVFVFLTKSFGGWLGIAVMLVLALLVALWNRHRLVVKSRESSHSE